jgi:uncharacterized protein (TIGR02270 family)
MTQQTPRYVTAVIDQHAEEAAFQWILRCAAASAPHYTVADLANLDITIDAHLDGLRIAEDYGWEVCCNEMERKYKAGEVFVCSALAFESGIERRISTVLEMATQEIVFADTVASTLGWFGWEMAEKYLINLLSSKEPKLQSIGIAASAIHRYDPGKILNDAVHDINPELRARAFKAVGELRRKDIASTLQSALTDSNEECSFWAAWALTLLGSSEGIPILQKIAETESQNSVRAAILASRFMPIEKSKQWLNKVSTNKNLARQAIVMAGSIGDPGNMEWIIDQMESPEVSRFAGEAFSMITGIDLDYHDLDKDAPRGFESGPSDDPEDENVELDADVDLPWPDQKLIQEWWNKNSKKFTKGSRYLAGKEISKQWCTELLDIGMQRQRIAAALELARLGEPFVETKISGFRQGS